MSKIGSVITSIGPQVLPEKSRAHLIGAALATIALGCGLCYTFVSIHTNVMTKASIFGGSGILYLLSGAAYCSRKRPYEAPDEIQDNLDNAFTRYQGKKVFVALPQNEAEVILLIHHASGQKERRTIAVDAYNTALNELDGNGYSLIPPYNLQ